MSRVSVAFLTPFVAAAAAFAQTPSPDSQTTQALLVEVRQLRQDLQNAAATIQRVQIVMFRLQDQSAVLSRATDRLNDARLRCTQAQAQLKMVAVQLEQAEARQRSAQNPADQRAAEGMLAQFKTEAEMAANEEQECRAGEIEAESQFRAEQAKLNDLQEQLDKLDRVLAGYGAK